MNLRIAVIRWIQSVLWMSMMFGMSTDIGSSNNSSRFIGPFLRWLIPQIRAETIADIQFYVRKFAHVTEYGILALLLWRAVTASRLPGRLNKKPYFLAWIVALIFAISDELHQSFYASRTASPWMWCLMPSGRPWH